MGPTPSVLIFVGASAGLDLKLGSRRQHHLRAGLGVHYSFFTYSIWKEYRKGVASFTLTPTLSYLHEFSFGMVVGASWRALCPVYPREEEDYAAAMIFSLMIGY